MVNWFKKTSAALRHRVGLIDPSRLSAADAAELVQVFSDIERAAQAGRSLATQASLSTGAWRGKGYRSAAQWMAAKAQTSLSAAITTLNTANRLTKLTATKQAFVEGRLSEIQAAEIAQAAEADPRSESKLLSQAPRQTVGELRFSCRGVRAAAAGDEAAAWRHRRKRYFRHRVDSDGMIYVEAKLAPDDGATLLAPVKAKTKLLYDAAHRSGIGESWQAHAADAVVAVAAGKDSVKATVYVHVDAAALERGHTVAGERCEIEGIGPIPVETANRLAMGGFVKALAKDGSEVTRSVSYGRTIRADVRAGLDARGHRCEVPWCEMTEGLEIDHIVSHPVGATEIPNLAWLCRYHHAEKTHRGWVIAGPVGKRLWFHPLKTAGLAVDRHGVIHELPDGNGKGTGKGTGDAPSGRSPPARGP